MLNYLLPILIGALFLLACGNDAASTPAETLPEPTDTQVETPVADEYTGTLFAWVDNLNLRAQPAPDGTVITTVQSATRLEPTGERSAQSMPYVLRGVLYESPWIEVTTPDGKRGWVYGGAIKTEREEKGNPAWTDTRFKFDHFGSYDLARWKKTGTVKGDDEGDFDGQTVSYQRDGENLEISQYNGEYGYGYTHSLRDAGGELQRERRFQFNNDVREITEEVIDYTSSPPVRYYRKQSTPLATSQLNARPILVRGEWKKEPYTNEQ